MSVCSPIEISREELTIGIELCVSSHNIRLLMCTAHRLLGGVFVKVRNWENDLSSSVFDGHHHRKNTLFKAREDDVAIIEIPDESLGNSFSCVDS